MKRDLNKIEAELFNISLTLMKDYGSQSLCATLRDFGDIHLKLSTVRHIFETITFMRGDRGLRDSICKSLRWRIDHIEASLRVLKMLHIFSIPLENIEEVLSRYEQDEKSEVMKPVQQPGSNDNKQDYKIVYGTNSNDF